MITLPHIWFFPKILWLSISSFFANYLHKIKKNLVNGTLQMNHLQGSYYLLTYESINEACEVGRKLNAIVTLKVIGGSWDQRVCGRQFFYTEIAIIFAFVLVLDIICPKNSILKRSLTLVYFPMARLETPPIIKLRKSWSTIYFTDL